VTDASGSTRTSNFAEAVAREFCGAVGNHDAGNCEMGRAAGEAAVRVIERRRARRPTIVVLCGSTRFYDEFQWANYQLTMQGKIVLSVGVYPHATERSGFGEDVEHDSAEKVTLDELHLRKIDLADEVLVINVGGYVGESTRREVEYALAQGKPVTYLESDRYPAPYSLPPRRHDRRGYEPQ
jgi:hypothetical protein